MDTREDLLRMCVAQSLFPILMRRFVPGRLFSQNIRGHLLVGRSCMCTDELLPVDFQVRSVCGHSRVLLSFKDASFPGQAQKLEPRRQSVKLKLMVKVKLRLPLALPLWQVL